MQPHLSYLLLRLIQQIQAFQDGGYMSLSVPERKKYITNKFIQLGYTPIQTASIVGNLQAENDTFDPSRREVGGGPGVGIAQWTNKPRKDGLLALQNPYDIDTQIEYLHQEIQGKMPVWSNNAGGREAFMNAKTVEEATLIFRKDFERPSEKYARDNKRTKFALETMSLIDPDYQLPQFASQEEQTTPSPTPTLDELNRISPADIWEMYKDEPSKAAELIAFKNEYEERLQKEAQAEKQAEVDLQKQALAQAQAEKQIVKNLLTTPTTPQEDYNAQIAQPQQPTQPFRFQTDWFNPMQEMQRGGTQQGVTQQEWDIKINFNSPFVNNDFLERRTSEEVLTPMGVNFLMEAEGFRDRPYLDTAKVPTIGYGTTYYPDGRPVSMNDPVITEEQAKRYKNNSLKEFWGEIEKSIKQPLKPHQKDAVVSLAYNIGPDAFKESTLLKLLNSNPNDPTIEKEFLKWNKERDRKTNKYREVKGLTNRRQKEASIYFNGYEIEFLQQGGTISPLQRIKQKFQQI